MPKKKPTKPREDRIIDKAMDAKALLYIHGFLSESENARVFERIKKRVETNKKRRTENE